MMLFIVNIAEDIRASVTSLSTTKPTGLPEQSVNVNLTFSGIACCY